MTRDNELLRRGDAETLLMMYVPQGQYAKAINDLRAVAPAPDLSDPVTVHANMLRGTIAKPTVEQIIHLYGADALRAALPAVVPALHRSFPEAGDGRPLPPMGDELMTAGLNAEDARFVAVQLAQNGWTLTPNPVDVSPGPDPVVKPTPTLAEALAVPEVKALVEAAQDAEYDLLQWIACTEYLTTAGFNMDGTPEVADKLTAALRLIGGEE